MQIFNAGVFSVGYSNGFLRRIRYGETELLRMIYMALRDQNWNTFEPIIENEKIDSHPDGFEVQYDCFHELGGNRIFKWRVAITGNNQGEITFQITGDALADVLKNRAGLCILHPIKHTSGSICELHHTDGSTEKSTFPTNISAENPFKNLKSFRWMCQGNWYSLQFEGDGFETEDQRNWCDASYKTFCTPLDIPFPVLLKAGAKVHQRVVFNAVDRLPVISINTNKAVEIVATDKRLKLPRIGISASTETATLTEANILALRELNLSHYRIDVRLYEDKWRDTFHFDCQSAAQLRLPLEIALHVSVPSDLKNFLEVCEHAKPDIQQIILLTNDAPATSQELINEGLSLKKKYPSLLFGAGTDYNYRELNVNRFDAGDLDFISYSIDPQEHATDDLTILENVAAEADTVESARVLYGSSKRVHISSLTLKKRFNPAATVPADRVLSNERKSDQRQQMDFAAAFTLGSIKYLSIAGANSVTLFQTVGNQGVMSVDGVKYPVYHLLRQFGQGQEHKIIDTESSHPLIADALLLVNGEVRNLILVNFTDSEQSLSFEDRTYHLPAYTTQTITIS